MSTSVTASPTRRKARTGQLPGPAMASAILAIAYVAISTASVVDLIDQHSRLRPQDRAIADIALWITVPLLAVFVVGIILVFTKRSVAVLQAIAALNLVLAVNVMLRSMDVITVVNVAAPALIAGLLGAQSVRQFFAR